MNVSIIIPVYNTRDYLEICLESVVNQTYEDIEILLIDDGSTDGSEDICDYYALNDARVRVVHQNNSGLVAARKMGVSNSKGKYILFIDSDDWIEADYIETMLNNIDTDTDVIVSNLIREMPNSSVEIPGMIPPGKYRKNDFKEKIYPFMIRDWKTGISGIQPFIAGKMFRKAIFEKYMFECDERITLGEDGAVVYTCLPSCEKIVIINYSGYHWIIHSDSMSRSYSIDSFEKINYLDTYLKKWFINNGLLEVFEKQVNLWILHDFLLPTVNSVYGTEAGAISFIPPYELLEKGEKIVIYGAGRVGRSFVRSILKSGYADIAGWIDSNVEGIEYGIEIQKPEQLASIICDKVVVAVLDKNIADIIIENLEYVVEKNKIIWKVYDWG